jgi:hypothetical protein
MGFILRYTSEGIACPRIQCDGCEGSRGTRRSAALLIKKASTVSGVAMRRVDISGRQRIVYNKNSWSYDGS